MLPDIPITPVVAKVQSSATDPVHAVLDSSTLNVNVVNTVQNTVPVNVQNQITLPNEYPITTSSSLSVTETNPIQLPTSYPITTSSPIDVNVINQQTLPLEYPIANPYYENQLVLFQSYLQTESLTQTTATSSAVGLWITVPFTINITEPYNVYYSFSNLNHFGSDKDKYAYICFAGRNFTDEIKEKLLYNKQFKLRKEEDAPDITPSKMYLYNKSFNETPKFTFYGNYNENDHLIPNDPSTSVFDSVKFQLNKGSLAHLGEVQFTVNFYFRAKFLYDYLHN